MSHFATISVLCSRVFQDHAIWNHLISTLPMYLWCFLLETFILSHPQTLMCYNWKSLTDGIIKPNVVQSMVVSLFTQHSQYCIGVSFLFLATLHLQLLL